MRVRLWGTRGSLATAGPATIRYGGNTSCVEVRPAEDHLIVLDAGSGIRALGTSVGDEVRRIDVLLTHLHMDHIQGLGFFAPLFEDRAEDPHLGTAVDPCHPARSAHALPVAAAVPGPLRDFASQPVLHDVPTERSMALAAVTVTAALVIHPGPTVGYRLGTDGGRSPTSLTTSPRSAAASLPGRPSGSPGCGSPTARDVLIHDAQYTDAEYAERRRLGAQHDRARHRLRLGRRRAASRDVPPRPCARRRQHRSGDGVGRHSRRTGRGGRARGSRVRPVVSRAGRRHRLAGRGHEPASR